MPSYTSGSNRPPFIYICQRWVLGKNKKYSQNWWFFMVIIPMVESKKSPTKNSKTKYKLKNWKGTSANSLQNLLKKNFPAKPPDLTLRNPIPRTDSRIEHPFFRLGKHLYLHPTQKGCQPCTLAPQILPQILDWVS